MLTCPAARLTMAAGIKKGEILRGPPFNSAWCSRSMTSNPPTPEPICTPTRVAFSGVTSRPDIFTASSVAAIARWMKRAIFFTSFFSMKFSGSKFLTSAAIWQAKLPASKEVIRVTPLLPATIFFQTSALVLPTPQISPKPVTTTRLAKLLSAFRVLVDVIDGVFDGADFLRVLVRDLDVKSFFERHDQLDSIQRVCAEIVHEGGVGSDFAFIHPELLHDDLFDLFFYGCWHTVCRLLVLQAYCFTDVACFSIFFGPVISDSDDPSRGTKTPSGQRIGASACTNEALGVSSALQVHDGPCHIFHTPARIRLIA